jgi:DNA polymerase-3 subunit delta'
LVTGIEKGSGKAESRSKTEISIDQIRQIQHLASLPPFEGRYRVFIIDGTEFLSIEAANCLLKTLEEPFEKVLFVLMARSLRDIPDTVISRCQKLELMPLAADEVERELTAGREVEEQKAKLLAKLCRGCIGWAISACADDGLLRRYREDRDHILDVVNYGYVERFAYASQLARQFNQKRENTLDIINLWLDLWHDIMLIKTGFAEAVINIDIEEKLNRLAEETEISDIVNLIKNIQQTGQNLRRNVNPRLALEVLMMDIPERKRERIRR